MRLITAIEIQAKCKEHSELKKLSKEEKKRLAELVEERVPSGLAPIEEWNEAISYFSNAKPEKDCQKAKKKLLSILREEKRHDLFNLHTKKTEEL